MLPEESTSDINFSFFPLCQEKNQCSTQKPPKEKKIQQSQTETNQPTYLKETAEKGEPNERACRRNEKKDA